jgi:hypothetical protein
MPRLAKRSESPAVYAEDIYDATPEPSGLEQPSSAVPSTSPSPSISSDKENRAHEAASSKGKGRPVPQPVSRSNTGLSDASDRVSKRKRGDLSARDAPRSQRRRTLEVQEEDSEGDEGYDPDQDIEERRQLRRGLRDLTKAVADNQAEYLNPTSTGLHEILNRANAIASSVKQTADATIDSRLIVQTADLSYRKTVQLTLGDNAQGVDVDEFIMKCISMMRQAGPAEDGFRSAASHRNRRRSNNAGSDDEAEDDGDMLNWEALGHLALRHNSRPSVPGFLLGPLSLEKRARKAVQRKAPLKSTIARQTQPEILNPGDIEKQENANLTTLCSRILTQLKKVQAEGEAAVEAEAVDGMSDDEVRDLMFKHGVHSSGGVDLFKFVVNPHSFGQTVENMFYVSFLIRDGKVGISIDDDGLPAVGT